MKLSIIRLFSFSVVLSVFVSCEKNDDGQGSMVVTTKTVRDLPADTILGINTITGQPFGAGKYTFYSLENNVIIPSADSATSKWDIGFRGTTIITNSGNSGPGKGGGFVFTGLFDDLKTIPLDSTIRLDNAPTSYAIPNGSNRGWYVYNAPVNLITAIPGRVLVIRTASGKFAKVEILNYYKGGVTPATTDSDDIKLRRQRFFTFRFTFQPNGSRNF
jgi:hypothetical protein